MVFQNELFAKLKTFKGTIMMSEVAEERIWKYIYENDLLGHIHVPVTI